MDLASITFISTNKSWHCVTSIKITLKILLPRFTYKNKTDGFNCPSVQFKIIYRLSMRSMPSEFSALQGD